MKKEARENYETQILELRKTIKEYQDCLSHEQLEKEKIHRAYLHEKFQLGRAYEKIKNMKAGIFYEAYVELKNNDKYWEQRCLGAEAIMAQMDGVIKTLQYLYTKWKIKYANMVVLKTMPSKIPRKTEGGGASHVPRKY